MDSKEIKRIKIGIREKQILFLLMTGAQLLLTYNSRKKLNILKSIPYQLEKIRKDKIKEAINRLYHSKLIDFREKPDGDVVLTLTDNGKKKILIYNFDKIKLKRSSKWDGYWRMVIFDIPEYLKKERDFFSKKLKEMGFYSIQKSIFIYPYECKNELDFMIEVLNLRKFVRFILVKEIDIDLHLRKIFKLI